MIENAGFQESWCFKVLSSLKYCLNRLCAYFLKVRMIVKTPVCKKPMSAQFSVPEWLFLSRSDVESLSPSSQAFLRCYQYNCIDRSFLGRTVLRRYWQWVVEHCIPEWMAPNVVTAIGFAAMLSCLPVLMYFDWYLQGTKGFIYPYYMAAVWVYSTADACDGRQARRTGSASPLGELFDHGCDALNTCTVTSLILSSALGLGRDPSRLWLGLCCVFAGFWVPTWENFHMGTMYLGRFNAPTEGIVLLELVLLVTCLKGPSFWWDGKLLGIKLVDWLAVASLFNAGWSFHGACKRIHAKRQQHLWFVLPQAVPVLVSFASISLLFEAAKFCQTQTLPSTLTFGLIFAKVTSRIIWARLTGISFPGFSRLLSPLIFLAISSRFHDFDQVIRKCCMHGMLLLSLVSFLVWARAVIRVCEEALGVHCFRLP